MPLETQKPGFKLRKAIVSKNCAEDHHRIHRTAFIDKIKYQVHFSSSSMQNRNSELTVRGTLFGDEPGKGSWPRAIGYTIGSPASSQAVCQCSRETTEAQ